MKTSTWLVMVVLGLTGSGFGGVIFQDTFEDENVDQRAEHWTIPDPWVLQWSDFFVMAEPAPYGKALHAHLYTTDLYYYTMDSLRTFTAAEMTNWWTLTFDYLDYHNYATWSYHDVLRTPGNFRLEKDGWRAVNVYDSNGTLLGSTNNSLTSSDTWTHYAVEYRNGALTVTASTAAETTTGTFTVSAPDYVTRANVSFGTMGYSGTCYTDVDNIVVAAVVPSLQGRVTFEGYLGDNATVGVKFELTPAGGGSTITRYAMLDAAGGFRLDEIPEDTYRVAVKNNASLRTVVPNVLINGTPTVLADPIVLRGDDVNGDNMVSFEDFSILQNTYGQSGGAAGANPLAAAATGGCSGLGILVLSILGLTLRGKD